MPEGVQRPLWSVMIPTFNCAKHLRQTLESVLAQDPGADQMQIEVVDDCSTQDDPETVVREVGKGRVVFYRKPKNEGATANFNTCIRRSHGHLIHILHGDDWVLPGFYQCIESSASAHPETGLLATRCFFADEEGNLTDVTPLMPLMTLPTQVVSGFYMRTPLQCAGVVVRRSCYEECGGFRADLLHTADWEMWARVVYLKGGIVRSQELACYRVFLANDSGRLMRIAENLRDRERLIKILASRHLDFPRQAAMQKLLIMAQEQEARFEKLADHSAASANRAYWNDHASFGRRLLRGVGDFLKNAGHLISCNELACDNPKGSSGNRVKKFGVAEKKDGSGIERFPRCEP